MLNLKTLEKKTGPELVKIYNGLGPAKVLKRWSKAKGELIERILIAQKQHDVVETAAPAKKKRTGEIRALCEDLLTFVAFHENKDKDIGEDNMLKKAGKNTRPVGLSFAAILDQVKKEIPESSTSYACLRWYAVHLRRADVVLPRRPKSSWK